MKQVRFITTAIPLAFVIGCSTPGPTVKTVEQSDKKPSWANITRTTFRDGDKMKFVGFFTADGDARPSAAIHGAGVKANAMPLQAITDDFLQQSGVEEDLHDSSSKLIISVLRKSPPTIPGLQVIGSYYERVEIRGSEDTRTEIRAYSLSECPVSEFNQAKREAIQRLRGDSKVKQELDNIMSQQRDRSYGDREPASQSSAVDKSQPSDTDSGSD